MLSRITKTRLFALFCSLTAKRPRIIPDLKSKNPLVRVSSQNSSKSGKSTFNPFLLLFTPFLSIPHQKQPYSDLRHTLKYRFPKFWLKTSKSNYVFSRSKRRGVYFPPWSSLGIPELLPGGPKSVLGSPKSVPGVQNRSLEAPKSVPGGSKSVLEGSKIHPRGVL